MVYTCVSMGVTPIPSSSEFSRGFLVRLSLRANRSMLVSGFIEVSGFIDVSGFLIIIY